MDEEIKTLGQAHPAECRRVRGVLKQYQALGPDGLIGATLIEDVLARADDAQATQDVVKMIHSYQELKAVQ